MGGSEKQLQLLRLVSWKLVSLKVDKGWEKSTVRSGPTGSQA